MAKRYDLLDFFKPSAKVAYGSITSSTMGHSVSITDYAPNGVSLLINYEFLGRLTPLRVKLPVNSDDFISAWIPSSIKLVPNKPLYGDWTASSTNMFAQD